MGCALNKLGSLTNSVPTYLLQNEVVDMRAIINSQTFYQDSAKCHQTV